ncbi:MAG: hypothetical protein LBM98_02730 [Oscillospiraceae bacterium]|nr:hypothetical protein [Oscillospiraceae bacterium]
MRYVRCYRCEAIQCRGDNIRTTYRRCLRQPWIASPHITNYVSQVRRRLRKDGLGFALPCPGAMRRDGGRGYVRARRGEGGFETRPYVALVQAHSPLGRGAARRRRGGSPRRARRNPRPSLSSLIFDIC